MDIDMHDILEVGEINFHWNKCPTNCSHYDKKLGCKKSDSLYDYDVLQIIGNKIYCSLFKKEK